MFEARPGCSEIRLAVLTKSQADAGEINTLLVGQEISVVLLGLALWQCL
jgi:hypothetical protein